MRNRRILVFSPHDDDVTLGLGGYLYDQIHSHQAEVITYVFAMGGISSNVSCDVRLKEYQDAMMYLGVKSGNIRNYKTGLDGSLSSISNSIITGIMDDLMDTFKPDEVFCNYNSVHTDHQAVYKAFIGSLRLKDRFMPKNVYLYEYPFILTSYAQPPGGKVYFEMSDELMKSKCEAFKLHKSQIKPSPSPLGVDGIITLAKTRGLEIGCKYAECFYGWRLKKY